MAAGRNFLAVWKVKASWHRKPSLLKNQTPRADVRYCKAASKAGYANFVIAYLFIIARRLEESIANHKASGGEGELLGGF
jgi:hypothetical protein